MEARPGGGSRFGRAGTGAIIAVALLMLLAVLAVGELRYQSCIQKAEAEYPAVPVSAFNGRATGPVKVSFVKERADAIEGCGRL